MRATVAIYGMQEVGFHRLPAHAHDHCLTVMVDGRVISHLELERHTRVKHDNRLPELIDHLLDRGVVNLPDQFDLVVVNTCTGNAFVSRSGRFRFEVCPQDRLRGDLIPGAHWWDQAASAVLPRPVESFLCQHELAHAGSCLPFVGSFRDNSLLVHFDGGASRSNFSAYLCRSSAGRPELCPVAWHWDMIEVAELFSANPTTFDILNQPTDDFLGAGGKLMGLSSYGRDHPELAAFLLDHGLTRRGTADRAAKLTRAREQFGYPHCELGPSSPFSQDLARAFQTIFENALIRELERLRAKTGAQHLYYTGGCALNINANTRIVERGLFETIFIPPCCNDTGLSLGAAALLELRKHGRVELHSPYLNGVGTDLVPTCLGDLAAPAAEVIRLLMAGGVVGICNGYGEVGPRALGNRSIIALPSPANRDRVSIHCKLREVYRPVAPIMLPEAARSVFGISNIHPCAAYMLLALPVVPSWRERVGGIVHIDGTARPQVLDRVDSCPFLYKLLELLWNESGIPCLINTSFNSSGEPLVHTAEQALAAGRRMGLDAVVVDGVVVHTGTNLCDR